MLGFRTFWRRLLSLTSCHHARVQLFTVVFLLVPPAYPGRLAAPGTLIPLEMIPKQRYSSLQTPAGCAHLATSVRGHIGCSLHNPVIKSKWFWGVDASGHPFYLPEPGQHNKGDFLLPEAAPSQSPLQWQLDLMVTAQQGNALEIKEEDEDAIIIREKSAGDIVNYLRLCPNGVNCRLSLDNKYKVELRTSADSRQVQMTFPDAGIVDLTTSKDSGEAILDILIQDGLFDLLDQLLGWDDQQTYSVELPTGSTPLLALSKAPTPSMQQLTKQLSNLGRGRGSDTLKLSANGSTKKKLPVTGQSSAKSDYFLLDQLSPLDGHALTNTRFSHFKGWLERNITGSEFTLLIPRDQQQPLIDHVKQHASTTKSKYQAAAAAAHSLYELRVHWSNHPQLQGRFSEQDLTAVDTMLTQVLRQYLGIQDKKNHTPLWDREWNRQDKAPDTNRRLAIDECAQSLDCSRQWRTDSSLIINIISELDNVYIAIRDLPHVRAVIVLPGQVLVYTPLAESETDDTGAASRNGWDQIWATLNQYFLSVSGPIQIRASIAKDQHNDNGLFSSSGLSGSSYKTLTRISDRPIPLITPKAHAEHLEIKRAEGLSAFIECIRREIKHKHRKANQSSSAKEAEQHDRQLQALVAQLSDFHSTQKLNPLISRLLAVPANSSHHQDIISLAYQLPGITVDAEAMEVEQPSALAEQSVLLSTAVSSMAASSTSAPPVPTRRKEKRVVSYTEDADQPPKMKVSASDTQLVSKSTTLQETLVVPAPILVPIPAPTLSPPAMLPPPPAATGVAVAIGVAPPPPPPPPPPPLVSEPLVILSPEKQFSSAYQEWDNERSSIKKQGALNSIAKKLWRTPANRHFLFQDYYAFVIYQLEQKQLTPSADLRLFQQHLDILKSQEQLTPDHIQKLKTHFSRMAISTKRADLLQQIIALMIAANASPQQLESLLTEEAEASHYCGVMVTAIEHQLRTLWLNPELQLAIQPHTWITWLQEKNPARVAAMRPYYSALENIQKQEGNSSSPEIRLFDQLLAGYRPASTLMITLVPEELIQGTKKDRTSPQNDAEDTENQSKLIIEGISNNSWLMGMKRELREQMQVIAETLSGMASSSHDQQKQHLIQAASEVLSPDTEIGANYLKLEKIWLQQLRDMLQQLAQASDQNGHHDNAGYYVQLAANIHTGLLESTCYNQGSWQKELTDFLKPLSGLSDKTKDLVSVYQVICEQVQLLKGKSQQQQRWQELQAAVMEKNWKQVSTTLFSANSSGPRYSQSGLRQTQKKEASSKEPAYSATPTERLNHAIGETQRLRHVTFTPEEKHQLFAWLKTTIPAPTGSAINTKVDALAQKKVTIRAFEAQIKGVDTLTDGEKRFVIDMAVHKNISISAFPLFVANQAISISTARNEASENQTHEQDRQQSASRSGSDSSSHNSQITQPASKPESEPEPEPKPEPESKEKPMEQEPGVPPSDDDGLDTDSFHSLSSGEQASNDEQ